MVLSLVLKGSASAAIPDDGPLFPADSTAIFLSGLPGDSENESAYREQLQNWVDIVAGSRQAQKCLLFCDQPSALNLPPQFAATVDKGDREHFLKLPALLAGATNPIVVVMWGHGGKQAAMPVFHVRGPRLTPADLQGVAAKMPAVPSRWVLIFPGSGSFARAIAGAGREILSSDCEMGFSADPVGMPLLIKLARSKPALPFSGLAQELGRSAANWYAERNLARTEEPALWLGEQPPQLLAEATSNRGASEQANAAQGSAESPTETSSGRAEAPAPKSTGSAPALANGGAGWERIKKVRPQDYPEADAIVLSSRQTCLLASNPAMITEKDEFIQVLTREGKRFGDFDLAFSPPDEELELLDCEVLRPDGQVARLDQEVIGESGARPLADYQTTRRKFFSLPGVVPGAVLHVHYRSQWKEFPLPRISMEIPIAGDLPILESTVEVGLPKDCPFHFAFDGISAPDPVMSHSSYSASYTWRLEKLPAESTEPLQAPHRRPGLLVSTFADWRTFADWYEHISKMTGEVTPEIAAKARELTQGSTGQRAKVEAVYNFVTGLRYVAIPLGVNSLRPHAAANVLENQFGDCKDKANLLNTLLHALNIEADLVLVPRFSQACESLPGLAFNHAISRVKLENEILWLDTTDDVCRFGLLPPGDAGRKVLVADGRTASLTQLGVSEPGRNRLSIHGKLNYSGSAASFPLELAAESSGYVDYQFRRSAQQAKEHHSMVALLEARLRPVAGSFALDQQSSTAVSALDRDFCWRGLGAGLGLVSSSSGKSALHSPFWLPREWDLALGHRTGSLFLNEGYPLALEEQFEVALPPNVETEALPRPVQNDQPPLRWRMEWTRPAKSKLLAHLNLELVRGDLSLAETTAFQKQLSELLAQMGSDVLLSVPSPAG